MCQKDPSPKKQTNLKWNRFVMTSSGSLIGAGICSKDQNNSHPNKEKQEKSSLQQQRRPKTGFYKIHVYPCSLEVIKDINDGDE